MTELCSVGLDLSIVPNIANALSRAKDQGFHFLFIPIVHPRFKRKFVNGKWSHQDKSLTRPDILLTSHEWRTLFVGKLSNYLDVDSTSSTKREQSECTLLQELSYAIHLNFAAILFKLKSSNCVQLARIILSKISSLNQIWVELPMSDNTHVYEPLCNDSKYEWLAEDPWEYWNKFRILCGYDRKIGVILEVPVDIPDDNIIDRWLGEPVKCLILNTIIFLTNNAGYPVLGIKHKELIKKFVDLKVQLALRGPERHFDMHLYVQYLENLYKGFHTNDPLKTNGQGQVFAFIFIFCILCT